MNSWTVASAIHDKRNHTKKKSIAAGGEVEEQKRRRAAYVVTFESMRRSYADSTTFLAKLCINSFHYCNQIFQTIKNTCKNAPETGMAVKGSSSCNSERKNERERERESKQKTRPAYVHLGIICFHFKTYFAASWDYFRLACRHRCRACHVIVTVYCLCLVSILPRSSSPKISQ